MSTRECEGGYQTRHSSRMVAIPVRRADNGQAAPALGRNSLVSSDIARRKVPPHFITILQVKS